MKKSKKAQRVLHDVEGTVLSGVDAALEWIEPKVEQAAHVIQDGVQKAKPVVQEQMHKLQPYLDDAQKRAEQTRERVAKEYVPAAQSKLGEAASVAADRIHDAEVPAFVDTAVTKVTGDKKAVKRAQKAAEAAMKNAAKELKKAQRAKNRKKGLLVFAALAAAATAGVAVWRASRPVEDPWKTPAPLTPAKPVTPKAPVAGPSAVTPAPADVKKAEDELPKPKPTTPKN
ncbi:hypothetical protein [Micrococcoides hystricis]|uniref:Transcriptional regulator n=1 Tax=Micrococcoides hystricis TaxID=1572761 RepID=A0ABV6PBI4_9MICC